MKQWQYVVAVMLLITSNNNRLSAQDSLLNSIIHPDSLKQLVYTLAADSFLGRFAGTAQCDQAADFIAGEFRKAGAAPLAGNNGYFMPFTFDWLKDTSLQAYNVVAAIPGKSRPGELVIFSAHYDHVGTSRTNRPIRIRARKLEKSDTIYNGANDNASGVSALISLARYFKKTDNNERTILFIAFSAEELGLVGSRFMRNSVDPSSVVAMINMDMVGRPVSRKNHSPYITGPYLSDLREILNKQLAAADSANYSKAYFKADYFKNERLFARSDNYWFARQGVPAHTILLTSPKDYYYHAPGDEPATLDYPLMAKVIRAIALGSAGLLNGTATPTRINASEIAE